MLILMKVQDYVLAIVLPKDFIEQRINQAAAIHKQCPKNIIIGGC